MCSHVSPWQPNWHLSLSTSTEWFEGKTYFPTLSWTIKPCICYIYIWAPPPLIYGHSQTIKSSTLESDQQAKRKPALCITVRYIISCMHDLWLLDTHDEAIGRLYAFVRCIKILLTCCGPCVCDIDDYTVSVSVNYKCNSQAIFAYIQNKTTLSPPYTWQISSKYGRYHLF